MHNLFNGKMHLLGLVVTFASLPGSYFFFFTFLIPTSYLVALLIKQYESPFPCIQQTDHNSHSVGQFTHMAVKNKNV